MKDPTRWQDVLIQAGHSKLTKQDIYNYYTNPKIQQHILNATGENEVILRQSFTPENVVLRRKDEHDAPIFLRGKSDLQTWASKRLTEVHPTFGKKTDHLLVDLDPGKDVPWEKVQTTAAQIAKVLGGTPGVNKVEAQYSGNRGFYVRGYLDKSLDIDKAREKVKGLLSPLAQADPLLTLGVKDNPQRQIRLDTTPLKYRGSVKAPYSLSAETGLVAAPVRLDDLGKLKRDDFTIGRIVKKAETLSQTKLAMNRFTRELLELGEKLSPGFREAYLQAGRMGRALTPIQRGMRRELLKNPAARKLMLAQPNVRQTESVVNDVMRKADFVKRPEYLENFNNLPVYTGSGYRSHPLSKFRQAEMAETARSAWSGRHQASPKAVVIPAGPTGETVRSSGSPDILFRGNPALEIRDRHGEGSTPIFTSRHPEVAAGYATGHAAGIRGDITRDLYAFTRPETGILREQPADLPISVSSKIPEEGLKHDIQKRLENTEQMRKAYAKHGIRDLGEDLGSSVPTYETILENAKALGEPIGQYKVVPVRTRTGFGYEVKDVTGVPAKEMFKQSSYLKIKEAASRLYRDRVEAFALTPDGKVIAGLYPADSHSKQNVAVPGGGVDPGENKLEAAKREFKEEAGIAIKNIRPVGIAPVLTAWSRKDKSYKGKDWQQEIKDHPKGNRTHFVVADVDTSESKRTPKDPTEFASTLKPRSVDSLITTQRRAIKIYSKSERLKQMRKRLEALFAIRRELEKKSFEIPQELIRGLAGSLDDLALAAWKVKQYNDPDQAQGNTPIDPRLLGLTNPARLANRRVQPLPSQPLSKESEEFAPGIPKSRKIHDIPAVKHTGWTLAVQRHFADKAGKHFDLRLVDPTSHKAHSFAIPKAKLPKPGEKRPLLAIQQPTHTADYALNFKGIIPKGTYGSGKVEMALKSPVDVIKANADKIHFKLENGDSYAMFRMKDKNWGIRNTTKTAAPISEIAGRARDFMTRSAGSVMQHAPVIQEALTSLGTGGVREAAMSLVPHLRKIPDAPGAFVQFMESGQPLSSGRSVVRSVRGPYVDKFNRRAAQALRQFRP